MAVWSRLYTVYDGLVYRINKQSRCMDDIDDIIIRCMMMYKSRILAMILGGLPREKDSEGNDIHFLGDCLRPSHRLIHKNHSMKFGQMIW